MNKRQKVNSVAISGIFVAALASCSDGAGSTQSQVSTSAEVPVSSTSQTSSARPTLTEPRLQPPTQENEEGRPEVVFDPCTWIGDAAVREAGLDPVSRRRGDDTVAEYTFLTCDFKGPLRDLQINSGNVSWEEDLQKNSSHSEPITVNGREALLVQDPQAQRVCSIHVRTEVGFVMFSSARTFEGSEAGLERCDGVLEIVTALEPEIGGGN
ncbi:DUF3558 domain-containing protein [Nocardia sp. NPDC003963]